MSKVTKVDPQLLAEQYRAFTSLLASRLIPALANLGPVERAQAIERIRQGKTLPGIDVQPDADGVTCTWGGEFLLRLSWEQARAMVPEPPEDAA